MLRVGEPLLSRLFQGVICTGFEWSIGVWYFATLQQVVVDLLAQVLSLQVVVVGRFGLAHVVRRSV